MNRTIFRGLAGLQMLCITVLGLVFFSACGDAGSASESTDLGVSQSEVQGVERLSFDSFDPALVSGSYKKLEFSSAIGPDGRQIEFWDNGKPVAQFTYNPVTFDLVMNIEASNGERKKFGELVDALQALDEAEVIATFGKDVGDTALGQLLKAATHCKTAPDDESIHHERKLDPAAAEITMLASGYWGDSGIRYLWQCHRSSSYQYATTYWDDYRGMVSYYGACGTSSGVCLGRCGSGCPCNSWYCFNRYYTQDCDDHDNCLEYNPGDATTSPFAPNCGNEWLEAADDYVFGSSSGW